MLNKREKEILTKSEAVIRYLKESTEEKTRKKLGRESFKMSEENIACLSSGVFAGVAIVLEMFDFELSDEFQEAMLNLAEETTNEG